MNEIEREAERKIKTVLFLFIGFWLLAWLLARLGVK